MSDTPNQTPQSTFDEKLDDILRSKISYMDYLQIGHSPQDIIEAKEVAENEIAEAKAAITSLVLEERVLQSATHEGKQGHEWGKYPAADTALVVEHLQEMKEAQQRSIITKEGR